MSMRVVLAVAFLLWSILSCAAEAGASVPISERAKLSAYVSDSNTTIIFIPGIFGSKLRCVDGNEYIWGKGNYGGGRLGLDSCPLAQPELMDKAEIVEFTKYFDRNVYSDLISSVILSTNGQIVSFPYDWRQSNKASAALFNDFICSNQAGFKDNVIVLAHSMGGLVLLHWIKDHLSSGASCKSPNVQTVDPTKFKQFVFAGTPFLGSPQVVKSLFSGQNSMSEDRLFHVFYKNHIVREAITFKSVYELIPAGNIIAENCLPPGKGPTPVMFKRGDAGRDVPLMLSSLEEWKRLAIPAAYPDRLADEQTRLKMIEAGISEASNVVCEIMTFVPPPDVDKRSTYIVGVLGQKGAATRSGRSTMVGGTVSRDPDEGDLVLEVASGDGDGTVPQKSAFVGTDMAGMRLVDQAHDSILDNHISKQVVSNIILATVLPRVPKEFKILDPAATKDQALETIKELGSIDPRLFSIDAYRDLSERLAEETRAAGLAGADIYNAVGKADLDDRVRAFGFSITTYSTDVNALTKAFAINNSAEFLYRSGVPELAAQQASRSIEFLDTLPDAELTNEIRPKSLSIRGKSRIAYRDMAGIEDLQAARRFGYSPAANHLKILNAM